MIKHIILSIVLLFQLQLFGATYTHDDFHEDITLVKSRLEVTDKSIVKFETKIEAMKESIGKLEADIERIDKKETTFQKLIEKINSGSYYIFALILICILALFTFLGINIKNYKTNFDKLLEQYRDSNTEAINRFDRRVEDIENDAERKILKIQEKADRAVSTALANVDATTNDSNAIPQTNSNDPF